MGSEHFVFANIERNIDSYLEMVNAENVRDLRVYSRVEPRARKADFGTALSFEVHDPLWMLTRQWQFGRFKGNDCGSAIMTKIKTSRRRLDSLSLKGNQENKREYSTDTPMEYDVEKRNRSITSFVRIESAVHFKKMVKQALLRMEGTKTMPATSKKLYEGLVKSLTNQFPLDPFIPFTREDEKTVETLKIEQNANLKRLYATYGKRIFDGYKIYNSSPSEYSSYIIKWLPDVLVEYKKWFAGKYFPIDNEEDNCWNEQKLGYEVSMGENGNIYEAEDYHTGTLSWYSFDGKEQAEKSNARRVEKEKKETKMLSYLPVPANYPCAPSKFLWQFEGAHVQFGNHENNDFSLLANAVVMQYTSMYGNDWMITPIEAEAGTILDVEGIIVTDTFGERIFINRSAEENDNKSNDVAFIDRWSLFGTTKTDAYAPENSDFTSMRGLLFPPTLPRCEEGKPIEEVQFLRDEMANMLWGVETVMDDGCGGILSGNDLSKAVLSVVDEQKDDFAGPEEGYEYSFLVQNRVPINWIPFIPQKISGEIRDIRFRRGKMPIYYNGKYNAVRPSTELLRIREEVGVDNKGKPITKIAPRFINEEEVTGYGVKLVLTAQRTRWFLGKSFNWIGAKKVISQYQANSGLMFDELIEKESNKAIKLKEIQSDTEMLSDEKV